MPEIDPARGAVAHVAIMASNAEDRAALADLIRAAMLTAGWAQAVVTDVRDPDTPHMSVTAVRPPKESPDAP